MKPVNRFDTYTVKGKATKLDSGFLRVPVFATRAGVFHYRKPDGSIRRELRHPDEVFKADSLGTLAGVPFTNKHPAELVTSKNVRKYIKGVVGDNVGREDEFVATSVTIMDEQTIADVEQKGLREVSCGYKCDVVDEAGEYNGEHYDAVQKNIKYNHLAGVPKGRAGSSVRLHLDADDAELVADDKRVGDLFNKPNGGKNMLVKIDGVEFEADNSLASAVTQSLEKRDQALVDVKKEVEAVKADAKKTQDELQAKLDNTTAELEKVKKDAADAPKVADLVKARVELVEKCKPHLDKKTVEKLDDMDDRAVKVAVIKSKVEKFDDANRSDDYINARFDGIIELDVSAKGKTPLDDALKGVDNSRKDGDDEPDVDKIRKDNMSKDEQAWQTPLGSFAVAAAGGAK